MTPQRFDELRANTLAGGDLLSVGDVAECLDEIARLAAMVYMPGVYHCPKCGFVVHKLIVNANTGNVMMRRHCDDVCPNDNTPLEPSTWEMDSRKMASVMPELAQLRREKRERGEHGVAVY